VDHELHHLLMDVVRAAGLLQPDQAVPGQAVSLSQVFALHELDTATPLSQRELADRLGLEKSTVSRLAAEMERKGLLARERDPDNRRLYRLRLTDEGRALHVSIASVFHEQFRRWLAAMSPAERDALHVGLPALVRAIRHGPGPWHSPTEPRPGHAAAAPV
jgi:DNA-binding MarR family transcriptional regulator